MKSGAVPTVGIAVFVLVPPRVLLLDVAGPIEVLRKANLEQDAVRFDVMYVGPLPEVNSSVGLGISGVSPLPDHLPDGALVVIAGGADAARNAQDTPGHRCRSRGRRSSTGCGRHDPARYTPRFRSVPARSACRPRRASSTATTAPPITPAPPSLPARSHHPPVSKRTACMSARRARDERRHHCRNRCDAPHDRGTVYRAPEWHFRCARYLVVYLRRGGGRSATFAVVGGAQSHSPCHSPRAGRHRWRIPPRDWSVEMLADVAVATARAICPGCSTSTPA